MAKYSYEFKKKIVDAYLNGEGGYRYLAQKSKLPDKSILQNWVRAYQAFGDKGLLRSRKNGSYTFEFKLSVVELYLTTEMSYQELAVSAGLNNLSLVARWVNDFRRAGPDALKKKSKGQKPMTQKPKNMVDTEENNQSLKQLQDENLKLRIENAYLKELRRLRLKEEAQKQKQELSATSEDYSD